MNLWNWFEDALIENPAIAVFLVLAAGFYIGRFSYRGIGLGAVTGTLLAGVALGALIGDELFVEPTVKNIFFLLFLFALGYKQGPQFFQGLKGTGLPQALFTVALVAVGLGTVLGLSLLLGYNPGLAAGLAAGGLTQSAIIGVAQGSISGLEQDAATLAQWSDLVPVAYAVTYIFGTVGAALYCSLLAPRLLGIRDLPQASRELEEKLGFHEPVPGVESAYPEVVRRSYLVSQGNLVGRTVQQVENDLSVDGARVFVARVRHHDEVVDTTPATVLSAGDTIVLTARRHELLHAAAGAQLHEVEDHDLLDFPIEQLTIVATSDEVVGYSVGALRTHPLSRRIFLKRLTRAGVEIPYGTDTIIHAGDELTVQGPLPLVEQVVDHVGFPERSTPQTDMVTIGLGVAVGALIGIPAVTVGGVPIGLTTSVGALLLGLFLGWRRSKGPTFGHVAPGAQWFFETVGLTCFVAAVGIDSGPGFVDGVREYGLGLLGAGIVVTLVPLVVSTFLARYVFHFDPVLTLGMLTGAQTTTAAVGAVQETARSSVPLLGFTVPYAIGNILLTVGGALIVAFTA